eukprot:COSAG01_NODE_45365_length_410_cov_0.585209_1_plen_85_part_10
MLMVVIAVVVIGAIGTRSPPPLIAQTNGPYCTHTSVDTARTTAAFGFYGSTCTPDPHMHRPARARRRRGVYENEGPQDILLQDRR